VYRSRLRLGRGRTVLTFLYVVAPPHVFFQLFRFAQGSPTMNPATLKNSLQNLFLFACLLCGPAAGCSLVADFPDPKGKDAVCGNGTVEDGEECDDGNTDDGDGCSSNCTSESECGNGVVEGQEECDDGNNDTTDACPDGLGGTCRYAICGDGLVHQGAETCDDGNTQDEDGCSSNCTLECGNGTLEGQEQCDTTNLAGMTCADFPDFNSGTLKCKEDCIFDFTDCVNITGCGNGSVEGEEQCDDGANGDPCDGCLDDCTASRCGDGFVCGTESCDDGNKENGDGCNENCTEEEGWTCNGTPSVCEPYCGDSLLVGDEECDDGNTESQDGCSAACIMEWKVDHTFPDTANLWGVTGKTNGKLFVVGDELLAHRDFPGSWSHETQSGIMFNDVWETDEDVVWAVGFDAANGINVSTWIHSTQWQDVTVTRFPNGLPNLQLWGVWGAFTESNWIVGDNSIYSCQGTCVDDTGYWNSVLFRDIHGTSATDVWTVGIHAGSNSGAVLHYAGSGWIAAATSNCFPSTTFMGVWADSSTADDDAWMVGEQNGHCFAAHVAYDSVNSQYIAEDFDCSAAMPHGALHGIWVDPDGIVWAVGDNGTILRYVPTAAMWYDVASPTTETLRAIWGVHETEIYAVGATGTVLHFEP
jgi:cysteine-rich repeat protein